MGRAIERVREETTSTAEKKGEETHLWQNKAISQTPPEAPEVQSNEKGAGEVGTICKFIC